MRKVRKCYAHLFPIWLWPSFHCIRLLWCIEKQINAPNRCHNCSKGILEWGKTKTEYIKTFMIIEIIGEALEWHTFIHHTNYTLYKNPGFWLVNSRCIFREFSYLLISFIFTAAGVFAWGFNFFHSVSSYLRKRISLFYPRVPQTAKFNRNISSLSVYVRYCD